MRRTFRTNSDTNLSVRKAHIIVAMKRNGAFESQNVLYERREDGTSDGERFGKDAAIESGARSPNDRSAADTRADPAGWARVAVDASDNRGMDSRRVSGTF